MTRWRFGRRTLPGLHLVAGLVIIAPSRLRLSCLRRRDTATVMIMAVIVVAGVDDITARHAHYLSIPRALLWASPSARFRSP